MLRYFLCALLAVAGAAGQTSITVSPQELNFAVGPGTTGSQTATLAIGAVGGNAPFSASVRYLSSPEGWLRLSAQTGATPGSVTVTADSSGLAAGTYTAQITISAAGLGRAVPVSLVVGASPSAPGLLLANPTALTFIGGTGGEQSAPIATISVFTPPGSSPVTFRVVSSTRWISLPPGTFTTPVNIPVTAYQTGLEAGIYSGAVSLVPVAGGGPTVVPAILKAAGGTTTQYRLILAQPSLSLNYMYGQPSPNALSVTIGTNIPAGGPVSIPQFRATTSTPWMQLYTDFSPTADKATYGYPFGVGGELKVLFDPTALAPGNYTGNITIQADGLETQNLPVTLHVGLTPELNAAPSSVYLTDSSVYFAVATVIITSDNDISQTFTVATGADWLRVNPSSFSTGVSGATMSVTYAPGLNNGTYQSFITLTAGNGSVLTIPVRLDLVNAGVAQASLTPVPASITLNGVRGQANPTQILQITTDYGRTHPFTIAASSTEGWLSTDVVNTTAPARTIVTANLAVLPSDGTYTGKLILTSLISSQTVEVPVTLNAQNDFLSVTPGQLTFTQPKRFGAFDPQQVKIDSVTPNATFRFLDVPAWLRVSDLSGAAPRTVTIWPEVSLLPPGSNQSTSIRIQGPNNTVTLPVSVSLAPPPTLTAIPDTVSLTYGMGSPVVPSQTVTIETGTEPNPFSVKVSTENNRDWLKVTPLSGTTPTELRVTVDPAVLSTGRFNGTITISLENGSGQTKAIAVQLAVNPPAAVIEAVLHGATQSPTPIAPGLMLTLAGNGFGSVNAITPKPTAAGAYETRVADTRVLFDGVAAPILFLRNDQINVIAPYALFGRISTRLQVEQNGVWSSPVDLRVVDSAPGLFTVGGTGRGQASAVNQDFSPNSALNPAERGSVVTVFGTGEGQTDAPGQDGRVIATDLRRPLLPVTATIGGRPAEVLYAGSASGMVSGTFQVNLRVPTDVEVGSVPVRIQIGSAISAANVTIVVK